MQSKYLKLAKIFLLPIMLLVTTFALTGCEEKEKIEYNQEKLIELEYYQIYDEARDPNYKDYADYKLHACIYNDGRVYIWADTFKELYTEEEIETVTFSLSQEKVQKIRKLLEKKDAFNLRDNMGNRDMKTGNLKAFTVYTSKGEHRTYGLNSSNKAFLEVYDDTYDLIREKFVLFKASVDEKQIEAYEHRDRIGPRICDKLDKDIFLTDMVAAIGVEVVAPVVDDTATATDAFVEATEEEADLYKIYIQLNEEATALLAKQTEGAGETKADYIVYNDDKFFDVITVTGEITDGKLYLDSIMDEGTANIRVSELSLYLEKWKVYMSK